MRRSAFTLIELSIVLTIISLIIGGILAGTALIESNLTRSIIVDLNKYQSSITIFKSKYDYFPGDLPLATTYFASNNLGVSPNNGNGNGYIEISSDGTIIENLYAWQHLFLADLITGYFSGVKGNIPSSRIDGASFDFAQNSAYGSNYYIIALASINNSTSSFGFNGSAITPSVAYNIDSKIDDGNPVTGKIIGLRGADLANNNVCVDKSYSSTVTSANYLFVTDLSASCRLWYIYY